MNELNELMTRESGPVVRLLEKLERTLAEAGRLTENYRPRAGRRTLPDGQGGGATAEDQPTHLAGTPGCGTHGLYPVGRKNPLPRVGHRADAT